MPHYLPEKCLRGLDSCEPLGQIASDEGEKSFICVGRNDGSDRQIKQDCYTMCWKNSQIDQRDHWDKRDLTHTASVILDALAIVEEESCQ